MPAIQDSAYVNVETVNNLIRAMGNDMIFSQAGEVLTDTANFMFILLNEALAWVTRELSNAGVDSFTKETYLTPILPIAVNDPGVQVAVSDTGYFDGLNNWPTPFVPTDLLEPVRIWERQTDSTEEWVPMYRRLNGLESVAQGTRLHIWEWRQDQIVMTGATQSNDLRLRYKGSQAQLVTVNDTVYIRDGAGPVANKMLSIYYVTKNPQLSTTFGAMAMERLSQATTASARSKQNVTTTRRSYGNPSGGPRFIPPRNS